MQYKVEQPLCHFDFWAGARQTVEELSYSEIDEIEQYLESLDVEWTDTDINDFFWFERDTIAEILGYDDFDEILEENRRFYSED